MTRRQLYSELVEAAAFAVLALVVAIIGEPQPLAIITAGLGALTAAFIAVRALNRYLDPGPPTVTPPAGRHADTLHAGDGEEAGDV